MGFVLLFLMFIYSSLVILFPYIVGILLSTLIIFLIKRKVVIEEQKYMKIKSIILIFWLGIFLISSPLWYNYVSAIPDNTYIEMKKMNDNN